MNLQPSTFELQPSTSAGEVASNLALVHDRVDRAARAAGRNPVEVSVVGVTKTFPPSVIELALQAGLLMVGENRVQEAQIKIPAVRAAGFEPEWHFIGHLQTNKVRAALPLFQMIQSVDSVKLAQTVDRVAGEQNAVIPVLIEVNTSGEKSKHGFTPTEALEGAEMIMRYSHLEIRGLMTVGPLSGDRAEVRAAFRSLLRARDRLAVRLGAVGWDTLSMGMSDDFEIAVEEGSTMIRVGRAIFGHRE